MLVVLTGSDPATAAELIRAVAVRQTVTSSFRPYLLVPPSVEPIAHGHRLVAESILPEDAWARLHPQRPWSTYLRERTRAARLTFGADSVLATDGSDPRLVVETLDAGTG